MDDNTQETLQAAVYRLVVRFVQRQQLPLEVILKYRPHLVDSTKRRPTKEYASATQIGHWGQDNEWDYFLHGVGCRLTHTITGEVIDWDASNVYLFDRYSLGWWRTWFLQHNSQDEAASVILVMVNEKGEVFREKIFDVLEHLRLSGKLRIYPEYANKYELIS